MQPRHMSMTSNLLSFLPLVLASTLVLWTGCASYPLGLSQEQWVALPPAQQAELRARQDALNEQARLDLAAESLRRTQAEDARQSAERDRLAAVKRDARYGDIVTVTIQGGEVAFSGQRFPFEPVAFDLVRGESRLVEFHRQGRPASTTLIEMGLSEDGHTFIFDVPARRRIVLTAEGWQAGHTYIGFPDISARDGHSEATGISIRLRFKPLPPPSRPIFEPR
jgi:hypothetical protein